MPQARSLYHLRVHHRIGGISPHQATKDQICDSRQGGLKNAAMELERADGEWGFEVQGGRVTRGLGDWETGGLRDLYFLYTYLISTVPKT
jgi:hypothetical protein